MHGGVFHRRKGAARLACSLHQLVELNLTGYTNAGFYRLMLCVCVGVVSADLESGRHESICGLELSFFFHW